MDKPFLLPLVAFILFFPFASHSTTFHTLSRYSSLSPPQDFLVSLPNGVFTAGFYAVGDNAYVFAVWLTEALSDGSYTIVWMANRDTPVNMRDTKLFLSESGNLVLTDAGQIVVWMSNTSPKSPVELILDDNGNLVLQYENREGYVWQSFDSPTDTLLPHQPLTRDTMLISSRSRTDCSSGFYRLYFDNDNMLHLLYRGVQIVSVFWPFPWFNSWQAGRTTYNNSIIAVLDSDGWFVSSDNFSFRAADYGFGPLRRLTLDHDGNVRAYSLDRGERIWKVTWQVTIESCKTHGICGANALCTYNPALGETCTCLPGYKAANVMDWSEGCVPEFEIPCNDSKASYFLQINHSEFYGYDIGYFQNYTLEACKNLCLRYCECKGFQYKFEPVNGFYSCFPKTLMFNGYQSIGFEYWIYLRLPKGGSFSNQISSQESRLECNNEVKALDRAYKKQQVHSWLKPLWWCAGAVGAFEIVYLLIFLYKTQWPFSASSKGIHPTSTGFKRFTYGELKKASHNFSEEIGRGGSGVVYKGVLSDGRLAAIKNLNDAKQGEAEFLAEVTLIGQLNHSNLIGAWGYCAEGKHRLLVYEYAEHRSLADNLKSNNLDWSKMFGTALGMAKGLAYLHEECLEWVLHCDVKPQNILLDSDYQPKVADFGLSKLLNRGSSDQLSVSTIRGTRGYMAPEWVFHLPITSKVDVYSYGIVVLEMITGRSPQGVTVADENNCQMMDTSLRSWVREMTRASDEQVPSPSSGILRIVDPKVRGEYEMDKLESLIKLAMQCTEENKDARPTMRQVVDMLLYHQV